MAFMRTPSPPLKKSHQTMVSVAWAAPIVRAALARVANKTLRIMSIPPKLCWRLGRISSVLRLRFQPREALRADSSREKPRRQELLIRKFDIDKRARTAPRPAGGQPFRPRCP